MKTSLILLAVGLTILPEPCPADGNRSGTPVFSAEERTLCRQLSLANQPWATVRWEVSLTEARERAARERKPVFLVVNTGNVLGFV
jgi:hypothetical protein